VKLVSRLALSWLLICLQGPRWYDLPPVHTRGTRSIRELCRDRAGNLDPNPNLVSLGGPTGCVVSDEGRAIAEIASHGFKVSNPESYLRQFSASRGLKLNGSKIYSPPVSAEALPTAISLVSTVSSLAAFWGVRTSKPRARRDLRKELRDLLGARYSRERVREKIHLAGQSGRTYRFDFRVEVGNSRHLILDGVFPDATAINTRAIAHLDLAHANRPDLVQRMVYDERENWAASDITLLRMAAEIVSLTFYSDQI